ncbi:hypothetical protein QQY66_34375 [Streptomyces sp. DG2A-72]|uniref:hypothetical protein n=1 Tax=Streptomyces sp. DG2A-72 TaxID=3051386 RepID=UPI00265BFF21|nr:hypothetical protein [Streptomyces sp. DG2A-72]MDO0936548.1 hypothetical protein [Streptomyces sp. DG2A-72]
MGGTEDGEAMKKINIKNGYREEFPLDGPPEGFPVDHRWQFEVDRIAIERHDAGTASWNRNISDHSEFNGSEYMDETGIELLGCPSCGNHEHLIVDSRWDDPLTLLCRCGTVTTFPRQDEEPSRDWARNLLKRLILTAADPGWDARRLLQRLANHQNDERQRRARPHYLAPDDRDARLADAVDVDADDLGTALYTALDVQPPRRHGGHRFALLMTHVALALTVPAVRDSPDGLRLAEATATLLRDLQAESARTAHTRRPVLDQLHEWQQEDGPAVWQAAWARTLELVQPAFTRYLMCEGVLADGAAALTIALYVIAREEDIAPADVLSPQIRELAETRPGETPYDVVPRWEERLRALGHDPDQDGPVARLWRRLRTDHTSPPGATSALFSRRGPALTDGLECVLTTNWGVYLDHHCQPRT